MLNLKTIKEWFSRVNKSRSDASEAIEDPKELNEADIQLNDASEDTRRDRRLQDGITSKNSILDMKLDRRTLRSDRRLNLNSCYKGKSRRFTIDRRHTSSDRRVEG